MNANLCLILNFATTWAMVGLIWLIQIVHYALFAKVGAEQFRSYSADHQRLVTFIVLPLMVVELGTSFLLWTSRPQGVGNTSVGLGIILALAIWASTFVLQIPEHGQLALGFEEVAHQRLVTSNWIRTIAWTLRGLLSAWMVWTVMSASK